ncbi:hypothetical protein COB11_00960 [Candidatus Aerophobetes bacterium]|uniref:Glycosyl transferase family 25 domain-containing protein n=1 Tax=Aerophobetes bacterium TaxID=2030807 RepID=A0A2A4YNH8_UNCAE|nr:MAG: hypothetical protein COB11_00960 [Candidatus Aerophobetes bacterium]
MKCLLFLVGVFLFNIFVEAEPPRNLESYLKIVEEEVELSGLEEIDRVYVINLDKARNRWVYMQALSEKHNLKINRFSAVCGWEMTRRNLKKFYRHNLYKSCNARSISFGQIGVFLSHLSIIKHALENNYNRIWILEDDVVFIEDPQVLNSIISRLDEIDPDWEFLFTDVDSRFMKQDGSIIWYTFELNFGKNFDYSLVTSESFQPYESEDVVNIQHRLGAYSMILSRKGMQAIYAYFMKNCMRYAYDVDMNFCKDKHMYQTNRDIVTTHGVFGSTTAFEIEE